MRRYGLVTYVVRGTYCHRDSSRTPTSSVRARSTSTPESRPMHRYVHTSNLILCLPLSQPRRHSPSSSSSSSSSSERERMRMRMRPAVRSPQKPSQPTHVVKTRYSSRFSHKPPGPAAARRHRQTALLGDRGCAPRAFVVPELATELRSLDDWHDPHNQRLAHARARLTSMDLPTGRPLEIRWNLRGGESSARARALDLHRAQPLRKGQSKHKIYVLYKD